MWWKRPTSTSTSATNIRLRAQILEREIAKLPPGGPVLHMRRGAGAYICGEESSLLESIEGKRGLPRHKPPYPFQVGLFGLPTLINNIETLWWVRDIVEKGAEWWKGHGRNDRHGLRSYSVSGRVKNPGMKLAPAGITVRELIDEFCGGMADGHQFHAYLPGGASGGILPASMDDIPLDFGTLEKYGCFIGSAAVIIMSEQDSVKEAALNLMRFFEDESCGQCTPCRVGTQKAALLMERPVWNRELLDELSQAMRDASICGLGQAAANPLTSVIKYFPDEFCRRKLPNDEDPVRTRWPAGRGHQRRDHLAGRQAAGPRHSASLLFAAAGLPARRQLPRLHGRGRGRARAGGVLQAHADRRHESEVGERARGRGAEDGDGAAGRRPAGARDLARSRIRNSGTGPRRSRSPRAAFPAAERWHGDSSHPAMSVNLDACIQCGLCVRACREVQVNDVIGMAYRSHESKIVFDFDDPMGESTCVACGECVQACPTGALMPSVMLDENQTRVTYPDKKVELAVPVLRRRLPGHL